MNNIKIGQIHGEWWIDDSGSAQFADGDIGDMTHERYVIDTIRYKYDIEEFDDPDSREFKLSAWQEDGESIREAMVGSDSWFDEWDNNIEDESVLEEILDNMDITHILVARGATNDEAATAAGYGDAREFAMKYWGWKRVQGNNVETWNLNASDFQVIFSGLFDAYGESVDNSNFNIYCYSLKKYFEDVPYKIIEISEKAKDLFNHQNMRLGRKSWYKLLRYSALDLETLKNWGIQNDVADYALSILDQQEKGQAIAYLKSNPQASRSDLQAFLSQKNSRLTREQFFAQKYDLDYQTVKLLTEADPTNNNKYLEPLYKWFSSGSIRLPEDSYKTRDTLEFFNKYNSKFNSKNLFDYNTFQDLDVEADSLRGIDLSSNTEKIKAIKRDGSNIIRDDDNYAVIEVFTPEAAFYYSKNTKWCTSDPEAAEEYLADGPLYIIIDKQKNRKYQATHDFEQVADEQDRMVFEFGREGDGSPLGLDDQPQEIQNLARLIDESLVKTDEQELGFAFNVTKERVSPELEEKILEDPYVASNYAKDILQARWPEAEKYILQNPVSAVYYANKVIKGRWPEAEDKILAHPKLIYDYAATVLKGRFPKGEDALLNTIQASRQNQEEGDVKDSNLKSTIYIAISYAQNIMKDRWREIEPYIMPDSNLSMDYIKKVIKGPWPEAEKSISRIDFNAYNYAALTKERFPEGEKNIIKNLDYISDYAGQVIKGRWPEAEKFLVEKFYEYYNSTNRLRDADAHARKMSTKIYNRMDEYKRHVPEKFDWPEHEKIAEIMREIDIERGKSKYSMSWYKSIKRGQRMMTPEELAQYDNFNSPSAVNFTGSGLSSIIQIPGIAKTMTGQELLNEVIPKIQYELTKNNVHTIDTSPISQQNAIGLAVSSEPGIVHVDLQKIIDHISGSAMPANVQFDGTQMDADYGDAIFDEIAHEIKREIADTAAHESQHNIDYFDAYNEGRGFDTVQEAPAQNFGNQIGQRYFGNRPRSF